MFTADKLRGFTEDCLPSCQHCFSAKFCSSTCAAFAAMPGGCHTAQVCKGLARLSGLPLDADAQHLARFLLQAYSTKAAAATGSQQAAAIFSALLSLAVGSSSSLVPAHLAAVLYPVLCEAFVATGLLHDSLVTCDEAAALLEREAANGFCIMATAQPSVGRAVRGTGLYLNASRFNHACFPNVARFDAFDEPGDTSTLLHFRAMDPIAAGTELTISYFPISLGRAERNRRLLGDYGFVCTCTRCAQEGAAGALGSGDDSDGEAWEAGGDGYSAECVLLLPESDFFSPLNRLSSDMQCGFSSSSAPKKAVAALLHHPT